MYRNMYRLPLAPPATHHVKDFHDIIVANSPLYKDEVHFMHNLTH